MKDFSIEKLVFKPSIEALAIARFSLPQSPVRFNFSILAAANVGQLSEVKQKRMAVKPRHPRQSKPSKSEDALSVGVER